MSDRIRRFVRATVGSSKGLLASVVLTAALPLASHASVVETFDWVPISENPVAAKTTTASGTLQLTLSSFTLTNSTSGPPNFGPYYLSGASAAANITGFSYTDGDGLSVGLSNVTAKSVTSSAWATSGVDTPSAGSQGAVAPTAGYYLVSAFTMSGTTSLGTAFMIGNAAGTAGATYANGIGNGTNTFNAASGYAAIADGGYWKLESVTPVPLPAALPLLLAGIGGLGTRVRRRKLAIA